MLSAESGQVDTGPRLIDDVLTTTRSVRKRLDFDRTVERSVVEECLRLAFQAPNAGNAQRWGWIVVDDPATKSQMAEIYRGGLEDLARDRPETAPTNMTDTDAAIPAPRKKLGYSLAYLADNLHRAPILVVPTISSSFGRDTTFAQASTWASIMPAAWSFQLALRSRGLGSVWTTLHLQREQDMAELLGIPHPENTQAGLLPVAYTLGTRFSPADRTRSEQRIFWNRWSGD